MYKFLIITAFLAASCRVAAATAPDFTVTDSGGKTHHLYADYVNKGKVLVLEIFFTTCPPCATHAPLWQSLYDTMKSHYPGRVEFMMLTNKSFDLNANVNQYISSKGLTMPGIGVEGGSLVAVQPYEGNQFGTFYGTPTFIIIAPDSGEVIFDIRGDYPQQTMGLIQQKVQQLLSPACVLKTFKGDTLQQYSLTVSVPGGASKTSQVSNGIFSWESSAGLPAAPFYQVKPAKNNDPLNGVSTFDLLQINKQILGVELFSSPWQFVAADANNSGTVSTFDIVEFRKLILGIYDSLPNAPSWVFSPEQDTMSVNACPDLIAIKKGDVNGNSDPKSLLGASDRNGSFWRLSLENRYLQAGESALLRLKLDGTTGYCQGMQAALRFDPQAVDVLEVGAAAMPGFDESMWRLGEGRITLSWFTETPAAALPVLLVRARAVRTGETGAWFSLDSTRLYAEAYGADGGVHPLEWRPTGLPEGGVLLAPNPANDMFVLSFESPEDWNAILQIRNSVGQLLFRKAILVTAGSNRIEVHPGRLPNGLYRVQVGERLAGKLIWQE